MSIKIAERYEVRLGELQGRAETISSGSWLLIRSSEVDALIQECRECVGECFWEIDPSPSTIHEEVTMTRTKPGNWAENEAASNIFRAWQYSQTREELFENFGLSKTEFSQRSDLVGEWTSDMEQAMRYRTKMWKQISIALIPLTFGIAVGFLPVFRKEPLARGLLATTGFVGALPSIYTAGRKGREAKNWVDEARLNFF